MLFSPLNSLPPPTIYTTGNAGIASGSAHCGVQTGVGVIRLEQNNVGSRGHRVSPLHVHAISVAQPESTQRPDRSAPPFWLSTEKLGEWGLPKLPSKAARSLVI